MKINDEHLYHGAALLQIAEHPKFTAINPIDEVSGLMARGAYRVNKDIGVALKYSSEPKKGEYQFTFDEDYLHKLDQVTEKVRSMFVGLVCVRDREIACIEYVQLAELMYERYRDTGWEEGQYVVWVEVPPGKSLRVYAKKAGRGSGVAGSQLIISRRAFPKAFLG